LFHTQGAATLAMGGILGLSRGGLLLALPLALSKKAQKAHSPGQAQRHPGDCRIIKGYALKGQKH